MVTLSPADERLVSSWLLQKVPGDAGAMVENGGSAFAGGFTPSAQCGYESK